MQTSLYNKEIIHNDGVVMNSILRSNYSKFFVFVIAFVLLWLRREDILTNAQFWAEDSVFWYKDAYENGFLNSLLTPRNGYFQTVSTLIVGGTTFINPVHAPFVSNFFGLFFRAIIVWFLFTSRFSFIKTAPKILIFFYILWMPGMEEVHANITNTHWYLSLYVTMIIVANKAETIEWKAHDIVFIILSGLSGPFIIFILASTIFKFYSEHHKSITVRKFISFYLTPSYVVMIACSLIQLLTIFLTFNDSRSSAPLGFNLEVISSIISSNVFLFTFSPWEIAVSGWNNRLLSSLISISFISMTVFLFVKGDWRARVIASLPILIFIFSMAKPQLTDTLPQLPTLINGQGERYFVNIHLVIYSLICVYIFHCKLSENIKIISCLYLSILTALMLYSNFHIPPLPDMNWKDNAELINKAKPGDTVSFSVVPPRLTLEIKKK
jgi:hypothetical protein